MSSAEHTPDTLLHRAQKKSEAKQEEQAHHESYTYANPVCVSTMPKESLPNHGLGNGKLVKQMIMDELLLDGNPRQNLASFVTTWMEPEAEELMIEGMKKNYIDFDEYPQTAEIHNRCVNMLCSLFNAPLKEEEEGTGTGTIGSSEAIMLAGLAMKWKWQQRRKSKDLSTDKPNLICSSNVQVCWHKMCRYFDIECREASVSPDCLVLTAERAKALIDENTIGVCAILGSTFNGQFENVKEIHDMVVELNNKNDWEIPIHVDAASGGFIAPFIHPELEWDFRLPMVKSINVSGHKFGLVYAGIGWVLFREKQDLPDELVFHVNYLGGDQASFTLNFSRGASGIVGQYYQFLRLGHSGYTQVMENGMKTAQYLRGIIKDIGMFDIVDTADMPLVAFSLKNTKYCTVFDLQDHLRGRGWIVPAYSCSKGAESLNIMRVVVKQNFTTDLADLLVRDLIAALHHFEQFPAHDSSTMKDKESAFTEANAKHKSEAATKKLWRDAVALLQRKNNHRTDDIKTHGVC